MADHRTGREEMWSRAHPNVQVAWDGTSLDCYMQCPRKYELEIKEGHRPIGTSVDILFGLIVGDGTQHYTSRRVAGDDHDAAVRSMVRFALKRARGGLRDEVSGEILPPIDEADAISKSPGYKNTRTALRTLVWWSEEYGRENAFQVGVRADGSAKVEESFRIPLGIEAPGVWAWDKGEEYLLCGHFDETGNLGDDEHVLERKTTKTSLGPYYWRRYHPNVQVDNYDVAGRVTLSDRFRGVIVEAIQVAKTFTRFDRHTVTRTARQAEEWLGEARMWIKRAEQDAMAGHWPMNTAACTLKGGCPFQGICSKDPGVRDLYLRGNFKRLPWNPVRVR